MAIEEIDQKTVKLDRSISDDVSVKLLPLLVTYIMSSSGNQLRSNFTPSSMDVSTESHVHIGHAKDIAMDSHSHSQGYDDEAKEMSMAMLSHSQIYDDEAKEMAIDDHSHISDYEAKEMAMDSHSHSQVYDAEAKDMTMVSHSHSIQVSENKDVAIDRNSHIHASKDEDDEPFLSEFTKVGAGHDTSTLPEETSVSQLIKVRVSHDTSTLPALALQLVQSHEKKPQKSRTLADHSEQDELLEKIAFLHREVDEYRKKRVEDCKANERLLSIFANKEQTWKSEKRKLTIEQRKLLQQLHKSLLQQEALKLTVERLRKLPPTPLCSKCEEVQRKILELKERICELEILSMATAEEAQAEKHEKISIAEKLESAEKCICNLQEKLAKSEECRASELVKHQQDMEQLEMQLRFAEDEKFKALRELESIQSKHPALVDQKNKCEIILAKMTSDMAHLQRSAKDKDNMISAMLKKASIDAEDRHELEQELSILRTKYRHAEKEKDKWKRIVEENYRSFSTRLQVLTNRNSFGGRADSGTLDMLAEMQNLHQIEIRNLQSAFEEEVKVLQERISMYRDRVADLEEEILVHISGGSKHLIKYHEHHGDDIEDTGSMIVLRESMEAELATKQFQLSSAKGLIKQYKDIEAHRKQEVEKWKSLYLASRSGTVNFHKENDLSVKQYKNPKWQNWMEMEKAKYALKLEQRHWQEITAFERQMKARDERMEAFRWQLLKMEDEAHQKTCEISSLKDSLSRALNERSQLEERLKQREEELNVYVQKLSMCLPSHESVETYEEKLHYLEEKVVDLQKMLMDKEVEFQRTLSRVTSEVETEINDRDCKLAIADAHLLQAHIICERERKEKDKLLTDFSKEKAALEKLLYVGFDTEQDSHHLQMALQKMSLRITEAQNQMSLHKDHKISDNWVKAVFKRFIMEQSESENADIQALQ